MAVCLRLQPDVPVLSLHVDSASANEFGAGAHCLLAQRLVPADAVDGDGARLAAAERGLCAVLRMHEGACKAVEDSVLADLRLLQGARADEAGAVRGHADAPVLFQQPDAIALAGQVTSGTRPRRPGADDGDIAIGLHSRASAIRLPSMERVPVHQVCERDFQSFHLLTGSWL